MGDRVSESISAASEQKKRDVLLNESRVMGGGLGAIAYGVLKGLEMGGAEHEVLASVRVLLEQHFCKLSNADCNLLCAVLAERLAQDRTAGGEWY